MGNTSSKLAYLKRAKPGVRDSVLFSETPPVSPLVEKVARAISDWHSEADWPLHTDRAIRAIQAVAEQLNREGYREARDYIESTLWEDPRPRSMSSNG